MRALVLLLIALPSFAAAQPPPGDVPPPPPGDVPPPPPGDVPPPPPGDVPPPPPGDVPPPPPAYDPATGGAVPPPPPPGVAAQPAAPGPGAYTHDGFHLRMAIGVGGGSVARTTRNDAVSGERESTVSGGAFAMEITIGGTIGPVMLGGVLALAAMGDEQIEYEDGGDPTALDGSFNLWILGFAADWYPSAEGGFHVGGAIGFAVMQGRIPEGSRASDLGIEQVGGVGFGLSLLTGYDFWVGEQWSMGPLLRMSIGQGHGEGELTTGTHVEEDDAGLAITLLFSAALH